MTAMLTFPEGFQWGSATAAHQVEGGNYLNDLSALEYAQPSVFGEVAGDTVDHWNRYADDISVLSAIGLNTYRFSIEWARIEPEEGQFSEAALGHYQKMIDACLARGVEPVITLHHFTQPRWMARQGGMTNLLFVDRFVRYSEFVVSRLTGIRIVCTINELNVPILVEDRLNAALGSAEGQDKLIAAEAAIGAPLSCSFLFSRRDTLITNGIEAHKRARDAIKALRPDLQVGVTLSLQDEQALPGGEHVRDARRDKYITPFLEAVKGDDFIGVQNYTRTYSRPDGTSGPRDGARMSVMGYEDWGGSIGEVCRYVWEQTKTPIIITENGWAGPTDQRRGEYITEALTGVHEAIADGADIRGYYYWTLLDNFEWVAGYGPKFGLIEVDRSTQKRKIRPSALVLGQIAAANGIALEPEASKDEEIAREAASRGGTPLGID